MRVSVVLYVYEYGELGVINDPQFGKKLVGAIHDWNGEVLNVPVNDGKMTAGDAVRVVAQVPSARDDVLLHLKNGKATSLTDGERIAVEKALEEHRRGRKPTSHL